MPTETKPTARYNNPTFDAQRGLITARRVAVSSSGGTITIPCQVRFFVIRNAHASVSFGMNFNSDTIDNYFTLDPGDRTPIVEIKDSVQINARGLGGDSTAEGIFWG
jgi:hypothetical protein